MSMLIPKTVYYNVVAARAQQDLSMRAAMLIPAGSSLASGAVLLVIHLTLASTRLNLGRQELYMLGQV